MNRIKERIEALRLQMKKAGVQAFYISGTDPHQSEYAPDYWQTRAFIAGFTGSAGLVVVTKDNAALWTDSRYFLQAEQQLEGTGIQLMKMRVEGTPSPAQWLAHQLMPGEKLGVDASCVSINQFQELKNELKKQDIETVSVGDLLDPIWEDRTPLPQNKVIVHEERFCGETRLQKMAKIRTEMRLKNADYCLLTSLDEIAWTFNLRGTDVVYNPVFLAYAVIEKNESYLFVVKNKLNEAIISSLKNDGTTILQYDEITDFLSRLKETSIIFDPSKTNQLLKENLTTSVNRIAGDSIPTVIKAIKSETEIDGFKNAMHKDGIAMVEFLYWLDQAVGKEKITEYNVRLKLKEFREKQDNFFGESFHPIVGYRDHGAIVHFSVTEETAHKIEKDGFLLFDSGGQYFDGTTDITRTIALAEPTAEMKKDFTLVLKGMINLSMAVFPENTTGCNLDVIARRPLWDNQLNYGHGTCHGIGYFLNVHEGPFSIRQEYNKHTIKPGMVMSNEPAFYREGKYGIRTENVMLCVEKGSSEFGRFLGFETLTLCPIDTSAIDISLLDQQEIDWLNDYHKKVFEELAPLMNVEIVDFLKELTKPIG